MTAPPLAPVQARHIVGARLGREPQDMLEAAVVLEAWAGVPAGEALDVGRALMRSTPPVSQPSMGRLQTPAAQHGHRVETVAFIAAVIAIACWAQPLAAGVGASAVQRGLLVALPLTLALQWLLRSRYLGRPQGLALLGRPPWALAACAGALFAVPAAALGLAGVVAGLLTLTWTAGTIVIRRGWSAAYALAVAAATAAMLAGMAPLGALAAVAAATAAAAGVAVARRAEAVQGAQPPGPWSRALTAGAIGAGLGVLLVADSGASWSMGPAPALALLPSTVASFWGGYHLWQFQHAMPRVLRGVAAADATPSGLAWPGLRILIGAVARLVAVTAVLSVTLVVVASWLGWRVGGVGVLVGFGLIALATLLVSLLESVGRGRLGLVAVAAGIAAEMALSVLVDAQFAGAGLIVGAGVAVVVMLPASIALLSRPASTLATSLWIT